MNLRRRHRSFTGSLARLLLHCLDHDDFAVLVVNLASSRCQHAVPLELLCLKLVAVSEHHTRLLTGHHITDDRRLRLSFLGQALARRRVYYVDLLGLGLLVFGRLQARLVYGSVDAGALLTLILSDDVHQLVLTPGTALLVRRGNLALDERTGAGNQQLALTPVLRRGRNLCLRSQIVA